MPSLAFALGDWLVILAFLALILGLGFSARLRDASLIQYLTAGRSLTLPAFVATLVSTWYGGILGVGESVSYYGVGAWLLIGVPYYAFGIAYAVWLGPKVRAAAEFSIPERLGKCFGPNVRIVAGILIFLLAAPAAHALMLGELLRAFTGWPLALCVTLAAACAMGLLVRGGLLADVRMAIPAFLAMYIGFAVMLVACTRLMAPSEVLTHLATPNLKAIDGGVGPLGVLSFFILGAWTLVDPGFHQRVASAESVETGRKGIWVSVLCWALFDFLSISTSLYALALLPQGGAPLLMFPALGQQVLPEGLKGLFVCGMLGTILSAFVGYTLVAGASLGRDVAAPFKGVTDDATIRRWTRVGLGLSVLVAIGLALQIESVVALWYSWSGAVVGALLIPLALAYGKSETAPKGVLASMILAFGASFIWLVVGTRTGNPFLQVSFMEQQFSLGTLIPGMLISAVTLGFGWIAGRKAG